jgi:methyl-accepting chemotaxis protein
MNVRNHASAILIGVATLTIATTTTISTQLFSGMTAAVEESQLDLMQATVESSLRNTESRAATRAALIADVPDVRRLLAASDRDGLVALTRDAFQRQHDQFGLDVMQFDVPPATCLVRIHAPERPPEDLSTFRPSVVAVNADHAPRHGVELSRSGASIIAVVPVLAPDGSHAGSLEMGLDFGPMLDDLDESFGLDATFFVLEEPLRAISTRVDPAALTDENRVGNHLKWYSTNWALTQSLVGAEDLGAIDEPVRYTRNVDGVPYGVLLVPVRSIAGEPIGVISVARDFSSTRAAAGRSLVWQALLALFASVVIAGAILVVIRGLLLRPLARVSSAMGELAQGQAGATIADVESMPDELQEIAKHHEAMRAKQAVRTLYGPGESS